MKEERKEKNALSSSYSAQAKHMRELNRKLDGVQQEQTVFERENGRLQKRCCSMEEEAGRFQEQLQKPRLENRKLLEKSSVINREVQEYRHLVETLQSELTLQEAKNRRSIDWQEKIHRGILSEILLRPRETKV